MIVARLPGELESARRAVAIGTFDGVHLGHRAVVRQAVEAGGTPTVVTFHPHPRDVLGYGVQGRGQSLNMRDNGLKVVIGLRPKSKGWQLAEQDGWKANETLFPLEEAAKRDHRKLGYCPHSGRQGQS